MDREQMMQDIVQLLHKVSDRHLRMIHRIVKNLAA